MNPSIAVVIPTHRRPALLARCLASVRAAPGADVRVIVVNDGGGAETTRLLAERFPEVVELRSTGDLWWAGSMNAGIRAAIAAGTRHCLVLNDDVTVAPDAIGALVATAEANPGAIICSVVVDAKRPDHVWAAGGGVSWPFRGEFHHRALPAGSDPGRAQTVDWSPGMGTLIPLSVFEKVGLYDEKNMPQYLGDADLCLRAKRAGIPTLVCPGSVIYNEVEVTGGIGSAGAISVRDAVAVFTSVRSSELLGARLTFLWRHCPTPVLLPALAYRYLRLVVHLGRRVLLRAVRRG